MARNLIYNVPSVAVTVDGVTGIHFGDEFAFRVELPDDGSALKNGVSGATTSININKTCVFTLALKPGSPTVDQLYELFTSQNEGRGRLFDISAETGVNEKINFAGCTIKGIGTIEGGGPEQAMREIVSNCQEFTPDKST